MIIRVFHGESGFRSTIGVFSLCGSEEHENQVLVAPLMERLLGDYERISDSRGKSGAERGRESSSMVDHRIGGWMKSGKIPKVREFRPLKNAVWELISFSALNQPHSFDGPFKNFR